MNKLLVAVGLCLIPIGCMGQNLFNGTVKATFSQNAFAKDAVAEAYGNGAGDKLLAWIEKKASTRANARANANLVRINGIYNQFTQVKGNKVVTYDGNGLSWVLFDGDKDSIYTIYPASQVGTALSLQEYKKMVDYDGAVFTRPKETDIKILGRTCKLVDDMAFADTNCVTHIWYTDDLQMPAKYVEHCMYGGFFGFPLLKAINIDDMNVKMVGFYQVMEIVEETVPDEAFQIPPGIQIVAADELNTYLYKDKKKAGAGDKGRTNLEEANLPLVGVAIPDIFWNF